MELPNNRVQNMLGLQSVVRSNTKRDDARLVRGATLSIRERDYVLASLSYGASHTWIMIRHILPNTISPILVATTLSVGNIILLESVLSFLGLGIQPPIPSISESQFFSIPPQP